MRSAPRIGLALLAMIALTTTAGADQLVCGDTGVTVSGAGPEAGDICAAVIEARHELASCGGLAWSVPIDIALVQQLPPHCLGAFHCGENRIELLSSADYADTESLGEGGLFSSLPGAQIQDSVIRHELVHAALADMPCPFNACPVAQEFIAYALQIEFLPEEARAAFAPEDGAEPVPRDRLNSMILMMAPEVFAVSAWRFFRQQDDPCGFVGGVARGDILLDRGVF